MKAKLCKKKHTQRNPRRILCSKTVLADRLFLNRYLAIPVFLIILGGIFYFTFEISETYLTKPLACLLRRLIDLLSLKLTSSGIPFWIHELIIHGICAGVGSILSFLPTIATLFFFLSLLEHSGYMDRVARILDRPMNQIGLSGKAILPLVTGFGCSVPAILAAGTLSSHRDQKLTIAMIPFLSCSAKLPIYLILTQVFFSSHRVLAMLLIYLTGILLAVCYALLLSRTRFHAGLPLATWHMAPYQIPRAKTIFRDVLQNSLGFVRKAFTVILIASAVIWILQNFTPALAMTSDSRESMLAVLGDFSHRFSHLWGLMTGERFRLSSPDFLQRSPSPARFPSWRKLRLAAPFRGFCAMFSPRPPPAAFSYSVCSTHHVLPLSLPSARPAANGGMPFILHCFRRQLRGG